MASYSEFGTSFADTYRDWLRDDRERDRERKKDKKVRKRAAEAKDEAIYDVLSARSQKKGDPLSQVVEQMGISTARPPVPEGPPVHPDVDEHRAPLPPDMGRIGPVELTPIEAVRRAAPEGRKERRAFLERVKGETDRVAAPLDAIKKAKALARAQLAAKKETWDEELALDLRRLEAIAGINREGQKEDRREDDQRENARYHGLEGSTWEQYLEDAGPKWKDEVVGGDMHNEWRKGARARSKASHSSKLTLSVKGAARAVRLGKDTEDIKAQYNTYEAGSVEHGIMNEAIDAAAAEPELAQQRALEAIRGKPQQAQATRKANIEIMKDDRIGVASAHRALTVWWNDTLKSVPAVWRTHKDGEMLVADKLGVPLDVMKMHEALRPGHAPDDINYDIYMKYKSGWFDAAKPINARLRKIRGGSDIPDINFNTPMSAFASIEKGLLTPEEKQKRATDLEVLKAFNRIDGDKDRLAEIDDPEVREGVEGQIYMSEGKVTVRRLEQSLTNMADFEELVSTQGKPKGVNFFAVTVPDKDKKMMPSFDQFNDRAAVAPFISRAAVRPGYTMTREDWKKVNDEGYEASGWSRDPKTKTLTDPLGKWIYSTHINPDYKGK